MGQQDHLRRGGVSPGRTSRGRLPGWGAGPRALAGWVRRWYGAEPLHLLALLAAFALAGYAVRAVVAAGQWRGFALWFAVAIVGHDLLLFPLYSLADLSLRRLLPGRPAGRRHGARSSHPRAGQARPDPARPGRRSSTTSGCPPPFRCCSCWSGSRSSSGLSARTYHRASGLVTSPYLGRWLAVTGVLFAASAASYAVALRRSRAPARRARRNRRMATSPGWRSHADGPGAPTDIGAAALH